MGPMPGPALPCTDRPQMSGVRPLLPPAPACPLLHAPALHRNPTLCLRHPAPGLAGFSHHPFLYSGLTPALLALKVRLTILELASDAHVSGLCDWWCHSLSRNIGQRSTCVRGLVSLVWDNVFHLESPLISERMGSDLEGGLCTRR